MQTLYERLLRGVVFVIADYSRDEEDKFVDTMKKIDSEMADEILRRLCVFEDVGLLDDRAIQKTLREVDTGELAKALRGADSEIQDKIFRNMSKRAASLLKEEMEYMGPVRRSEVEEMQQKIALIIRKLESRDEISVPRSAEDELIY